MTKKFESPDQALFKKFQKKYPTLYSTVECGFWCPPGWASLITEVSEILKDLPVRVIQVKSKFGRLTIYVQNTGEKHDFEAHQKATSAIGAVELKSCRTCVVCGEPGTSLKSDGRVSSEPTCEEHKKNG